MLSIALFALSAATAHAAAPYPWHEWHGSHPDWDVACLNNLVTFGDSYTDESGLLYFAEHFAQPPPVGTILPENDKTASGGKTWVRYVVEYTGTTLANGTFEPQLELRDYAISGASCSHEITPRNIPIYNIDFPSVIDYQVPAFQADIKADDAGFTVKPTADNSVYALWIGTNDLGVGCFLTDEQVRGKVLTDYTECVYSAFDGMYASGARKFVLMNTVPLQIAPLYANASFDGTTAANSGPYWPNKPANLTEISTKMHEFSTSVNTIFQYQTPFEVKIANRYPEASFALYDVHSLFLDIHANPSEYLNGTLPPVVDGCNRLCDPTGLNCVLADNGTSPDSYLWYDALHPSTQTDRIIARNFIDVLNGQSKYATYY